MKTNRILVSDLDSAMEIRNGSSEEQAAVKTVLEEGDTSLPPARVGATGELAFELHSLSGLKEVGCEVTNSKYFSRESGRCDFEIGTGQTSLDRELEKHLQSFHLAERSNLVFSVKLEPRMNTRTKTSIAAESRLTVDCDISLVSLDNADPVYRWFPETKLDKARQYYTSAVDLFKKARYLDSFYLFQPAYKLSVLASGIPESSKSEQEEEKINDNVTKMIEDRTETSEVEAEARRLRVSCLNNLAACHFQWGHHTAVIQLSSAVLHINSVMVKALYRRGVSHLALGDYDKCELDLVTAARLEPGNRAVQEQLGLARDRRGAEKRNLASKMQMMFTKS